MDIEFAMQVAMANKHQLKAMCDERGLATPTRASKAQLMRTLLLAVASEPRGALSSCTDAHSTDRAHSLGRFAVRTSSDSSPSPSASCGGGRTRSCGVLSKGNRICLAALEIFSQQLASVLASGQDDKWLSTLEISKACLVNRELNAYFGDSRVHCALDTSTLTRRGFMRELQRYHIPACQQPLRQEQRLLSLRISGRSDWVCSKSREEARRGTVINLTRRDPDTCEWWESDSEAAWMDFENHLYTSLQRLGQQGCLRNLVTLDLANPSAGRDSVGLLISSRLVELSRFSPHLQHLRLPEVTRHPLMAGPLRWPNFLVWFRSLRSFFLSLRPVLTVFWKSFCR